jgi:hypothetical protein
MASSPLSNNASWTKNSPRSLYNADPADGASIRSSVGSPGKEQQWQLRLMRRVRDVRVLLSLPRCWYSFRGTGTSTPIPLPGCNRQPHSSRTTCRVAAGLYQAASSCPHVTGSRFTVKLRPHVKQVRHAQMRWKPSAPAPAFRCKSCGHCSNAASGLQWQNIFLALHAGWIRSS